MTFGQNESNSSMPRELQRSSDIHKDNKRREFFAVQVVSTEVSNMSIDIQNTVMLELSLNVLAQRPIP
jgi:hypothetical protein